MCEFVRFELSNYSYKEYIVMEGVVCDYGNG